VRSNFDELNSHASAQQDRGLSRIAKRLAQSLERDALVQKTTDELRQMLQADRVVLYYFYQRWRGQVTFESLSTEHLSILGSTGADDCFNDEYAALYLEGRVRAIADIETEPIQACHRDFLRSLSVRANLVVPVLTNKGLWGLLIAHQCQVPHNWSTEEIKRMQQSATRLATAPAIRDT
jgi:GAF domain-containing protein